MSLSAFDALHLKEYDLEHYNCLHFAVDVWQTLYGVDLSCILPAFEPTGDILAVRQFSRLKGFKRLPKPATPCLAVFKSNFAELLHVGTYLDGRIFHLTERGAAYIEPAAILPMGFQEVQYYAYADLS